MTNIVEELQKIINSKMRIYITRYEYLPKLHKWIIESEKETMMHIADPNKYITDSDRAEISRLNKCEYERKRWLRLKENKR
jgi:hypothetical protein